MLVTIVYVSILAGVLGVLTSSRREYFQVSALAHATVLGAALACLKGRNMLFGAFLIMPIRALIVYRINSLDASVAIFGFSMGLAAYLLAISGSVSASWAILFGSLSINDPLALEVLKAFTVVAVIVLTNLFDELLYEAFDPETAYVYIKHLRIYVLAYYFLLSIGIVVLLRFLGAFLTIVVLSVPELIFRGVNPRSMIIMYVVLLMILFYLSSYTASPTGIATFGLAVIAGLMSIKNLKHS